MEPFIGQVMLFAGNFAPRGWAFCHGQLLPISGNEALFSLIGTTYGGDGRTTFGLPDLQGRSVVGTGNGPGLTPTPWGARGGAESHTLNVLEMPSHNHMVGTLSGTIGCNEEDGTTDEPTGNTFGVSSNGTPYNADANDRTLGQVVMSGETALQGGNRSFGIRNPFLSMNYVIALQGIYPSRS